MADFNLLYRLVSYIDEENSKNVTDPFLKGFYSGEVKAVGYIKESDCIAELLKDPRSSELKIRNTIDSALSSEHPYLEGIYLVAGEGRRLGVTAGSGQDFLKKIWKFKIGKWRDIIQHYTSYTVILSVIAILISLASLIVAYRYHSH